MKRVLPLLFLAACFGCGKPDRLFPMQVGNEWTYNVKTTLAEFVTKISISRRVPVAGVEGYELTSPMGVSRLAWKGDVLYASALSGTRFNPPLPILNAAEEKHSFRVQNLRMYSAGVTYDVDATVEQEAQAHTRDGQKYRATITVTTLRLKDREIQIKSIYKPGIGLVEQVQRTQTNGSGDSRKLFDLQMDCISGP